MASSSPFEFKKKLNDFNCCWGYETMNLVAFLSKRYSFHQFQNLNRVCVNDDWNAFSKILAGCEYLPSFGRSLNSCENVTTVYWVTPLSKLSKLQNSICLLTFLTSTDLFRQRTDIYIYIQSGLRRKKI